MPNEIKFILTAQPSEARSASSYGLPVAHMAYRMGRGAHLLRSNIPINLRGGLMVIDNTGFDGSGDINMFCQQVIRECSARCFDGIILDFEGLSEPFLGKVTEKLSSLASRRRWPLYVNETYAGFSDLTQIMIPSAISNGSLFQRLQQATERFGADRTVLAVQRVAEDYILPASAGISTSLSRAELAQRIESRGASIFFSDELCMHYFTYMSRKDGAHFVQFDNVASIRKKVRIAQGLGIRTCILAWPEVDDILGKILS